MVRMQILILSKEIIIVFVTVVVVTFLGNIESIDLWHEISFVGSQDIVK